MAASMMLTKNTHFFPSNFKMFRAILSRECFRFRLLAYAARSQSSVPQPSSAYSPESDYEDSPKYPALFDPSKLGRKRQFRQDRYDEIKAMPTAEEKLLEQCGDEPLGVITINGINNRFGTLATRQFCTRTHLINQLPAYYDGIVVDALADTLRPAVLDLIRTIFRDSGHYKANTSSIYYNVLQDRTNGHRMVDNMIRMVAQFALSDYQHLRDCQLDYDPRREAFWPAGGFYPSPHIKLRRKNQKFGAILPEDHPVDLLIQYSDDPYVQLRNEQPLPSFVSQDDPICTRVDVPKIEYQPNADGFKYNRRHPTSVPGVWPSDPCGFGTLSFYTREILKLGSCFERKSTLDNIHGLGVSSSFAWLCALAYNKGFSPYHELTYPLATQTVVTNGKLWSFYAYQLNTVCLSEDVSANDRQNICWATEELPLFDRVLEDGEVQGFNESVFKTLLKFLVNKPQARVGTNLTPYLAQHNHPDELWDFLWSQLKEKYCNRPRLDRKEIFLWEKIYKKWFKTVINTVDRTGRNL